ncbi:Cytoplasmic glyoxalase II [Gurleya vavrai]
MKVVSILIHTDNLTHIFYDSENIIVFDPSDPEIVLLARKKIFTKEFYMANEIKNLDDTVERKIIYSFTTHHHNDHSGGNSTIMKYCDNVYAYKITKNNYLYNKVFCDKEIFKLKNVTIKCFHTPCHTRDSFCFLVESDKNYLITGDTLFFFWVVVSFLKEAEKT